MLQNSKRYLKPWNPLSTNLNDKKPNQNSPSIYNQTQSMWVGSTFSVLFQKRKRCEFYLHMCVFLFQDINGNDLE